MIVAQNQSEQKERSRRNVMLMNSITTHLSTSFCRETQGLCAPVLYPVIVVVGCCYYENGLCGSGWWGLPIFSPCALILLLLFSSSSPRGTTARQRTQIRCCRPLILMVEQSRKGKKRKSEAAVKKNTIKTWQFIYQVQINISFNCISGFIQCRSSGPGFWVLNSANDPLSIVLILIPN